MDHSSADDRLRRLLGGPHTEWLVTRARRRLELGRPLTGTVTLVDASAEQRRAVELLLGRRPTSGASLSVSFDELDRTLRASGAGPDGLASAVERLTGPVRDRAGEAASVAAAWASAFRELDAVVGERPELTRWRAWLDTTGVVRRLVTEPVAARHVLDAVARVVSRLPSTGVPLGRLAAEACGDAHALDEGRPIATLALSAARALAGNSPAGGLPGDGASAGRRETWAAVGVYLDDLSSTVLCLGLPGDERSSLGRMLSAVRAGGEPCVLTLRQLRRHDGPVLPRGGVVRLCENPVVVAAAAEEFGSACPPLVCVNGRPSAAVWRLLDLLASDGAQFAYHGDFDWGGVAIATAVYERVGFAPWRYDAAAYDAATGSASLSGTPLPTPWDTSLFAAMSRRAVRIEEELVLDDLLGDLRP
ncbi:TIGR02679 family protein [Jiangella rhizosphaerae]|uniref:TIGR02679 family protein n=1 Tax=Jiangella rhizosphaerae TaxID=2293569 RepID=A0A418KM56_9ACTN|nr:TIGR02679 family protein [Jiangella rhizosphaerae]RIQ19470.1 TIGR02679 family protein [Jiangella rhizosphaerae]